MDKPLINDEEHEARTVERGVVQVLYVKHTHHEQIESDTK